jgi:hypothetical protein
VEEPWRENSAKPAHAQQRAKESVRHEQQAKTE